MDKTTVDERQVKEKTALIEQLKKMPVVQVACNRSNVSRATYYRWRTEDIGFRKESDAAIAEGEAVMTDMSESQLITLIKDKNFSAIQLYLRHHHAKYANQLKIVDERTDLDVLTPEQQTVVKAALKLAKLNFSSYETGTNTTDSTD